MTSLNSFSDQVSGLTANTVKTFAHSLHFSGSRFGKWKSVSIPTKLLVRDPSLFATRRRNPNLRFASRMIDGQHPLRLKAYHIAVSNQIGMQRVYNFNEAVAQNHLGFNPNEINHYGENKSEQKIKSVLTGIASNPETIGHEENYQNKRAPRPDQVVSRSKSFSHNLSIAGDRK